MSGETTLDALTAHAQACGEYAPPRCRRCQDTGIVWRQSREAPYSLTALSGANMTTEPCPCRRAAAAVGDDGRCATCQQRRPIVCAGLCRGCAQELDRTGDGL